jgi:hypothetical protein
MKTDHWLIIVSLLLLSALAGMMHLHTRNQEQAARIAALEAAAAARAAEDAASLVLLPPVDAPVSSPWGMRSDPMGGGEAGFHNGADRSVPIGTPVRASAAGVCKRPIRPLVLKCQDGQKSAVCREGNWGNVQMTRAGVCGKYAHLSKIFVRAGSREPADCRVIGEYRVSTGRIHWMLLWTLSRAAWKYRRRYGVKHTPDRGARVYDHAAADFKGRTLIVIPSAGDRDCYLPRRTAGAAQERLTPGVIT